MVPRYFAIFWRYRYHKSTDGTGTGTKKVPWYRYRGTLVPRYCPPMIMTALNYDDFQELKTGHSKGSDTSKCIN